MSNATPAENPLLTAEGLPSFDRLTPADVEPAVREILDATATAIDKIEADLSDPGLATWDNTIAVLERLGRNWERSWSPVTHLMGVANSDELREAHDLSLIHI